MTSTTARATFARLVLVALALLPMSALAFQKVETPLRGFIWKFEKGAQTGWLVGSLHLLTKDFYPLPASMTEAFGQADALIEEIDGNEAASPAFAAMVLSKAMLTQGATLSSTLSPGTLKKLTAWSAKSGLPLEAVQQMKPWMVALTLQTVAFQRLGFDAELGIDKHFGDLAVKARKPLIPLETAAEQIDFLDGLSPRTQDQMLSETIDSVETELTEITTLGNAWKAGDAAGVERLTLSDLKEAPEVYKVLLADRNRRWVPRIEGCVQTRRCFVVVGAAHLVGPDGLISLLRQAGYTMTQQ